MTRPLKIITIGAVSLAGLVIVLLLAALIVVQTAWFHNFVREKIISAVEDGTGGKADIGSFTFDWTHLRAQVRDFVIHGLEAPPSPPLFRANLVQIDLKLLSPAKGAVDIAYLLIDTPQANVIVYPDGHTNIPQPKTQQTSNKSGLQTVVDLAIGRFDLRNGSLTFAQRKSGFNASGNNLRAQLGYNPLMPRYVGELDISPLHLQSAGNAPLDVNVNLPVTIEADKISLANARLTTPGSLVQISGSIDHLVSPQTSARVNARLSLDELKRAGGLMIPLDTIRGPGELIADISASTGENRLSVQSARIRLGQSEITASGDLQQPNRPAGMRFEAGLQLGELGRLLRVSARPDGVIRVGGNARLDSSGNYNLQANITGRQLAAGQGATRITGATLDSSVTADPRRVQLGGLRLALLDGDLVGSGSLDNMRTFQFSGKLNNFGVKQISAFFKPGGIGYSGAISGDLQASGDVKNPSGLAARAALMIQPRSGGVPVSGRINTDYNGGTDTVNLGSSYLALPNTRLDFSGSIGHQIQVKLVTRNTADFRPVAAIPVSFQNGGNATLTATVTGSVSAPRIAAHAALADFSVNGRPFTRFDADLAASRSGATVTNAMLTHGMLQTEINASVGLRNWKPEDFEPVRADATIRNADVSDILALAGESSSPVEGQLNANAHVEGTIGDPVGSVNLSLTNGPSRLDATANYLRGEIG